MPSFPTDPCGRRPEEDAVAGAGQPVQQTLISIFRGRNVRMLTRTFVGTNARIISANSATGHLTRLNITIARIDRIAKFPRYLSNHIGALSPRVRTNVLTSVAGPSRTTRLRGFNVGPFSLIIIGLCPFTSAIHSNTSRTTIVRGVSVNNPSVIHNTTGGDTAITVIASPTSCTLITTHITGNRNFDLRRHH